MTAFGLASAEDAGARVECSVTGTTLSIDFVGDWPYTAGIVRDGNAIRVYVGRPPPGDGALADCGASPTVTNIDTIDVGNPDNVRRPHFIVSLEGGSFGPGASGEATQASEIEFDVMMQNAPAPPEVPSGGTFEVIGTAASEVMRFGLLPGNTRGANLNAAGEPSQPDVDVVFRSPTTYPPEYTLRVAADGSNPATGGDDIVAGMGGPEFSGPLETTAMEVWGGPGDDTLAQQHGITTFSGEQGNDSLTAPGFSAVVFMRPGPGNDYVAAGGTSDQVGYDDAPSGVSIDLSDHQPQETGGSGTDQLVGIEGAHGTPYDDVLRGTDGMNIIFGESRFGSPAGPGGDDVIEGRGGPDLLDGGGGNDTASYETPLGGGVRADLSAGNSSGAAGADGLFNFENVIGSPFEDTLIGTNGPNEMFGLGGPDTITTYDGADFIDVRNTDAGDSVQCGDPSPGPPADRVVADSKLFDSIGLDCEEIEYGPQPDTKIKRHPPKRMTSARAKFKLASDEENVTFECRMDKKTWIECDNRHTVRVRIGRHRFQVRALSEIGNADSTPAEFRFRRVAN